MLTPRPWLKPAALLLITLASALLSGCSRSPVQAGAAITVAGAAPRISAGGPGAAAGAAAARGAATGAAQAGTAPIPPSPRRTPQPVPAAPAAPVAEPEPPRKAAPQAQPRTAPAEEVKPLGPPPAPDFAPAKPLGPPPNPFTDAAPVEDAPGSVPGFPGIPLDSETGRAVTDAVPSESLPPGI